MVNKVYHIRSVTGKQYTVINKMLPKKLKVKQNATLDTNRSHKNRDYFICSYKRRKTIDQLYVRSMCDGLLSKSRYDDGPDSSSSTAYWLMPCLQC